MFRRVTGRLFRGRIPGSGRRAAASQRMTQSALFGRRSTRGRERWGDTGHVAPGRGGRQSATGVVASRRTFRRSVDRSRAKRLLRESYRLNRFRFCGKVDVVLVAKHDILNVTSRRSAKTFAEWHNARACWTGSEMT